MTAKCKWLGLAAVCATAALFVPPSSAGDPKPEAPATAGEAKQDEAGDVELLTAAYKLAEIGEKDKSPEALAAAGGLILKLKAGLVKGGLGELDAKPEVQDENGKPVAEAKAEPTKSESLDDMAQDYFDAAASMAADQNMSDQVAALIKAIKARKYPGRGARGGPKVLGFVLAPHQTHVYHIAFEPHALAAIGLEASAPIRTRMEAGGRLHFDQVTSVGHYTWLPPGKGTEEATITVTNPHGSKVTFRLITN